MISADQLDSFTDEEYMRFCQGLEEPGVQKTLIADFCVGNKKDRNRVTAKEEGDDHSFPELRAWMENLDRTLSAYDLDVNRRVMDLLEEAHGKYGRFLQMKDNGRLSPVIQKFQAVVQQFDREFGRGYRG